MALLFADGFEDGLADWGGAGNSTTTTNARNGSSALVVDMGRSITPATKVTLGFAVRWTSLSSNGGFGSNSTFVWLAADAGTVYHVGLHFLNDGSIVASRVSNNSLGATAAGVIAINTWYYIEVQAVIHDTTGSVIVKVDGVTKISATNVDTRNAGTSMLIDRVRFWPPNTPAVLIDDLYICDDTGSSNNDFLGDLAVEHIRPNADDSVAWTKSTGATNFGCVDEAGAVDTSDYVASSTVGQRDLYTTAAAVRLTGTVKGVYVAANMQKSDSGARSAGLCVKEGASGALRTGASQALTTGWLTYGQGFDRKADNSAFSMADLNALRVGVEVTA